MLRKALISFSENKSKFKIKLWIKKIILKSSILTYSLSTYSSIKLNIGVIILKFNLLHSNSVAYAS